MTRRILAHRRHRLNAGRLIGTAALVLIAVAGAAPVPAADLRPDAEIRQVLAPSGTLRVGVYPGSPTSLVRDSATGEAKGVSYDLGKELAVRLGVPFTVVEYPRVAAVV